LKLLLLKNRTQGVDLLHVQCSIAAHGPSWSERIHVKYGRGQTVWLGLLTHRLAMRQVLRRIVLLNFPLFGQLACCGSRFALRRHDTSI
jgi:hypothetical protein